MDLFARRLRERARHLGLSDAEVARRAGLLERRYGNYVTGSREPDFATLLRICTVLGVMPNDLLTDEAAPEARDPWLDRLVLAFQDLSSADRTAVVAQVEAFARNRRSG